MNSLHSESRNSAFDNIINILWTPITWSMIAEKLGVGLKTPAPSHGRGLLSINGEIKSGINGKYRVEGVDFDVTPNTCIVGAIAIGVSARVKIFLSQGKKPFAVSVVVISDSLKH